MKLELDDIKDDWKKATEGLASWRTEAKESYDFSASHQWSAEDIARLEDEERPAVTFDRIGVFVDAVCGMEVNNRQEITYLPVEQGDVRLDDTLTQVVKYYENDCGAEDEDSEAVRDAVICGVGVTETILSTDKNPDGAPTVFRRDPLSTWFDPGANRRNLMDGRFVFYGDWIPLEDAQKRWPDAAFSSEMPGNVGSQKTSHLADRAFEYQENATEDAHDGDVFILHYQCWKREDVYRMKDEQGKIVDFPKNKFSAAKQVFFTNNGRDPIEATAKNPNGDYVKTTKKVFYRAFVSGSEILEEAPLKIDAFTFNFITYKRDRNKKCWYGLVRTMKDPQRWANKWLSQILHIVNTNAKGGAFAEEGAFKDPRRAEELWAQANPLILLKEGGIDKLRERGQAQYPSGLDKLMQFAFNALPMVSGLNLEVLGLADREQAGVVESQRRQSAYQILAPLFAAIREYRKARGRLMLSFLKFVPQGTLVRIVGQGKEQWVPMILQDIKYDVKVDQAPDSPDFKKQTWDAMQTILPAMMKAGYPIPPEVLLSSPLPPEMSEKWVAWIKEQGWMPPEQKQQMQQLQEQLQQVGQENAQLKETNMAMRLDHTINMLKLQQKAASDQEKNAIKSSAIEADSMNRQMEMIVNSALKRLEIGVDSRMRGMELAVDTHHKNLEHGRKLQEAKEKQEKTDMKPININVTVPPGKKKMVVKKTPGGYEAETLE